ncbi:MAG: DUF4214 domain-containing protein, partial [Aquihabitans sp.]
NVTADLGRYLHRDGSLLLERREAGAVRLERFGPDGRPDTAFDDDGLASFACCGPDPAAPDVLAFARGSDDGADRGDAVALVRDGSHQALVRIGADGSTSAPFPIPVAGWASALVAAPLGGYALTVADREADPTATGAVYLRPDLTVDPSYGAAAEIAAATAVRVLDGGGRAIVATSDLATGTATLTAITATGIDTAYGDDGQVRTTVPAAKADEISVFGTHTFGIAADGRVMVAGLHGWLGTSDSPPIPRSVSQLDWFDAAGSSIEHREQAAGTIYRVLAAEPTRPGFIVLANLGSSWLERWAAVDPVPGPVRDASAVTHGLTTVSWQPPLPVAGATVAKYRVRAWEASDGPEAVDETVTATSALVQLPASGITHLIEITPIGVDGRSGAPARLVAVPPLPTAEAFVIQNAKDFFGTAPPPDEVAVTVGALAGGSLDAASLVVTGANSPAWKGRVHPVVRLYVSYFKRLPDRSGLQHWLAQRKAGMTVVRMSAIFARSSEFKLTYCALSNAAFVRIDYRNVHGREADASGLAYWTDRLDAGRTSRGQLMASFSESPENVRRRASDSEAVATTWGMVGRPPTAQERTEWAKHVGVPFALVRAIMSSPEYVARYP